MHINPVQGNSNQQQKIQESFLKQQRKYERILFLVYFSLFLSSIRRFSFFQIRVRNWVKWMMQNSYKCSNIEYFNFLGFVTNLIFKLWRFQVCPPCLICFLCAPFSYSCYICFPQLCQFFFYHVNMFFLLGFYLILSVCLFCFLVFKYPTYLLLPLQKTSFLISFRIYLCITRILCLFSIRSSFIAAFSSHISSLNSSNGPTSPIHPHYSGFHALKSLHTYTQIRVQTYMYIYM